MDSNKNHILESSKVAFINYLSEQKAPKHNYQKRSIFWDREHVYNENLMLRNKIKQLEEINTKTKTRLLRTEKDVATLSSSSMPKIKNNSMMRSTSTSHMNPEVQLLTMKWKVDALKEEQHSKKILLMKQTIRQLKQTIQQLTFQNNQLKKSIKYTRMSELNVENRELHEELIRLKGVISQNMKIREEMMKVFAEEKKDYRMTMQKEVIEKSKISKQLKKVQEQMNEMAKSARTARPKSNRNNPEREIKYNNETLKLDVETTKSKIFNQNVSRSRDDLVKLDYSQSVVSEVVKPMTNSHNPKSATNQELTSLQLLTLKNPAQQNFITPQKESEPKQQVPASEPIMRDQELKQDLPQTEPKSPLKNSALLQNSAKVNEIVQEQYPNDSEQYEDLMDY